MREKLEQLDAHIAGVELQGNSVAAILWWWMAVFDEVISIFQDAVLESCSFPDVIEAKTDCYNLLQTETTKSWWPHLGHKLVLMWKSGEEIVPLCLIKWMYWKLFYSKYWWKKMDRLLADSDEAGGTAAAVCWFQAVFWSGFEKFRRRRYCVWVFQKKITHGNKNDINKAWCASGAVQIT